VEVSLSAKLGSTVEIVYEKMALVVESVAVVRGSYYSRALSKDHDDLV
jgi:hypothetical protein